MATNRLPLDYTHLDALSDEVSQNLHRLIEGDYPDWFKYAEIEVLWFLTTLVNGRPGCLFDCSYSKERTSNEYTSPYAQILNEIDLPYTVKYEEYDYGEQETHSGKLKGVYVTQYFALSHDEEFINWYENQPSSRIPEGSHAYVGQSLGYPEEAVTAFTSEGWTGLDGIKKVLNNGFDSSTNPRYVEFSPYVPAPTEESVRTAIRHGKHISEVGHQIATERPFYENLEALIARVWPSDDYWKDWLSGNR